MLLPWVYWSFVLVQDHMQAFGALLGGFLAVYGLRFVHFAVVVPISLALLVSLLFRSFSDFY